MFSPESSVPGEGMLEPARPVFVINPVFAPAQSACPSGTAINILLTYGKGQWKNVHKKITIFF